MAEVTVSLKGHSPNSILISAEPSKWHSSQGYPGMSPHPGTVKARQLEGLRSGPRSFPPGVESGPGGGSRISESSKTSISGDVLSPQAAEGSGEEAEPGKGL